MADEFKAGLDLLREKIEKDYTQWAEGTKGFSTPVILPFGDLQFEEGRKFVKIIRYQFEQKSVWGFVMLSDDKKFKRGDILKAASWNNPAKNFARGNILQPDTLKNIRWTGAM